jgi:hypothetical protein
MITSDINSPRKRPGRARVYDPYRSWPDKVIQAAVRAGATLLDPPVSEITALSQYEFSGDLTNDRVYRSEVAR